MFDLSENYKISRQLASQGMVLLKNEDNTLPFSRNDRVGVIGKECLEIIRGGGGSANVKTEYVKNLYDGLKEKANENKVLFFEESAEIAKDTLNYSVPLLNELEKSIDTAIVTIKRFASEGSDRLLGSNLLANIEKNAYKGEDDESITDSYEDNVGYFYLSKRELNLLEKIEKSNIKNVVLLLNIASTIDLSFINNYSKLKAVLLVYFPGMESGTAIADVLCGDVNPSGKLVDTIAYNYEDYPSSDSFDYSPDVTEYKEGIYVGYRYFETYAKNKVMYPFGFGLSYTEFEYSNCNFCKNDDVITLTVDVKNIGLVSGREVVEAYICPPVKALERPSIELKGFYKTKELEAGETERVEISFSLYDISSFDESGATGHTAAWVLEKGDYNFFVGKSVRDLYFCGTLNIEETLNLKQLQLRFNGSKYNQINKNIKTTTKKDKYVSLYDVQDGNATLEQFIEQLSIEELVTLSQGQPPAFPLGTAGIGNIKKYDVPNPQTADGPAGIRRSVNTTCFPCGTLIACSWDEELQYKMGKAMGYEGYNTNLDIILAPSMNIHRNPLGGRNFEYFSEDPLITGKTASAIVNGVQSEGLCATIKHFAANNCEYYRKSNNSVISERALREIYLKGFEIAIKESNPAFVMSSYNLLNGVHSSENPQLLRGVLRDEWGYEGAVMTDWRNDVSLDDEILSGNNIKMPFGYPDETQKALDAYKNGKISIDILRENAYYVLNAVMKTRSFKNRDFGIKHHIDEKLLIPAIEVNGLSSTRVKQEKICDDWYLYNLGKDQRGLRTFIYYLINAENSGDYEITCTVSADCQNGEIWFFNENEKQIGTATLRVATEDNQWYDIKTSINLHKGDNILKLVFVEDTQEECVVQSDWVPVLKNIKLSKIVLEMTGS